MTSNPFTTLKQKQADLYTSIQAKPIIYLDLNYWINFLKYTKGLGEERPFTKELYELILSLAQNNQIIVPISDIHYYELCKNSRDRYDDLLQFFEALSQNHCFISEKQRWDNEILFCLRKLFGIENSQNLLLSELWTKPFFLTGDQVPAFDHLPTIADNKIAQLQTNFTNHAWEKSLTDIYAPFDENAVISPIEYEKEVTQLLHKGREENQNDYINFHDLLSKEIWGSLDCSKQLIENLLSEYFNNYIPNSSKIADQFNKIPTAERTIKMMYCITKALTETRKLDILPAISIGSCLHSLKRWQIQSRYQQSETFDIMHAKVALPYCDYFLTERTLCAFIKDNLIRLDQSFACKVFHNPEEAYKALSEDLGT